MFRATPYPANPARALAMAVAWLLLILFQPATPLRADVVEISGKKFEVAIPRGYIRVNPATEFHQAMVEDMPKEAIFLMVLVPKADWERMNDTSLPNKYFTHDGRIWSSRREEAEEFLRQRAAPPQRSLAVVCLSPELSSPLTEFKFRGFKNGTNRYAWKNALEMERKFPGIITDRTVSVEENLRRNGHKKFEGAFFLDPHQVTETSMAITAARRWTFGEGESRETYDSLCSLVGFAVNERLMVLMMLGPPSDLEYGRKFVHDWADWVRKSNPGPAFAEPAPLSALFQRPNGNWRIGMILSLVALALAVLRGLFRLIRG